MTDTHTHLYMPDAYEDGGTGAVARAIEAGVTRLVFPCVNIDSLAEMYRLNAEYPQNTFLCVGLHPTDLEGDWQKHLDEMESLLPGKFVAVGEVGIDLYHDASHREEQKEAFERQLWWGIRHELPVIIHCREGLDDTLEVIGRVKEEASSQGLGLPKLIFHCFPGGIEDVRQIRRVCDPWFGIGGVVTFKNAPKLRESLPEIGLERMVLETDAPWLSPAPMRGQRNESARIPFIRDCIAATLGVSPREVEEATDRNSDHIFFNKHNC